MPKKLDEYRQQILDFKEQGIPVREIASKLSDMAGERVAPSTVQHFIKVNNGESKESPAVDQAAVVDAVNHVALRLDELEARVVRRVEDHVNLVALLVTIFAAMLSGHVITGFALIALTLVYVWGIPRWLKKWLVVWKGVGRV